MNSRLLEKYNVPAPRYTSYPTVPYWQKEKPDAIAWQTRVVNAFAENNEISLYIHLPFCEALCTYCGCNKRITKNHAVETPYIKAVLQEWQLYLDLLPEKPVLRELHLGGGTPTFFSPESLDYFCCLTQIVYHDKTPNTTSLHQLHTRGFYRMANPFRPADEKFTGKGSRRIPGSSW